MDVKFYYFPVVFFFFFFNENVLRTVNCKAKFGELSSQKYTLNETFC